jgi:hypothetical protein
MKHVLIGIGMRSVLVLSVLLITGFWFVSNQLLPPVLKVLQSIVTDEIYIIRGLYELVTLFR